MKFLMPQFQYSSPKFCNGFPLFRYFLIQNCLGFKLPKRVCKLLPNKAFPSSNPNRTQSGDKSKIFIRFLLKVG